MSVGIGMAAWLTLGAHEQAPWISAAERARMDAAILDFDAADDRLQRYIYLTDPLVHLMVTVRSVRVLQDLRCWPFREG